MRNKIDYGIDLGTTNSAIARMENGVPTIKKSDTLKDTLPSCVHYNRRQDVIVGDAAYNTMKNDNARALKTFETGKTNTFIEFKRTMGTTHTYECSNMGRDFTSEELSSEVLKKLKSFIQDENISSIVITVPAKFLEPQNIATRKAAELAGFKQVELLQEPVAAATAYGLDTKNKDGYWLVFDFGGGTFDAAILKSEEGILAVKDTDGDALLGGKNLDEAIVDQIIIPNLKENFSIDGILSDTTQKELIRNAVKSYAEEVKIQLSFKDSHTILSNLGDLPFEDENGYEPEINVLITQKDMENVLGPIFQKAINISKDLLKRNNLKGSDLDALILVGGPTLSPILRRMLKEQITEKVDTSVDPMTVVAKGAALFASTISVSDEVKETTRDKTKLQLDIKFESATVQLEEFISLKALKEKTIGTFPEKIYADVVRFDDAWSSGQKLIGEKPTIFEVLLVEGRSNSFKINFFDEIGNRLEGQPSQFSILQGIQIGDPVLPYHIGIGKWFDFEEKELFLPIKGLEKNKFLPATGVINGLKTRSTVRPGMMNDKITIPIYQGDFNAEGTNPVLNNFISEVIISGENLPALLPEGSDVDITVKLDRSGLMKFSAYFPLINHTEILEIKVKQTEPPTEELLINEISKAKRSAQRVNSNEVIENLKLLEIQLENEKGSADGKLRILDNLRKELLGLDKAEKVAEWPNIEQNLKNTFYELEELVQKIQEMGVGEDLDMDKIISHLNEFRKKIELIIKEQNSKLAKEIIQEIDRLDFELRNAVTGNAIDVQYFNQINEDFAKFNWKDPNKAKLLINQGLQLIQEGKTTSIRPILVQLFELMPENEKPDHTKLGGGKP
jgi:molecular chaperone DnaK